MENGYSDDFEENETTDEDYDGEEDGESYSQSQEPLTENEVEELIAELVEVESKAAEAQEALEEEALLKVEADVRKELALPLSGDELEKAVVDDMDTYKEEWELMLDELERESAHLLEQLDGAGIDLSSLYKWIEKQVPNCCHTEAWKGRTHWVGTQVTEEATKSVSQAEEYLKIHRPVRRCYGASGFLGKKIAKCDDSVAVNNSTDKDWEAFGKLCSEAASLEDITRSSKHWASVYLASTPHQAAELGLKFAGVDEVEEIDDVDGTSSDPFVVDAIANERDLCLTEEQKRNFRKIKEEDDAKDDLKLHVRMKQMRRRKRNREGELSSINEESQMDVVMTHEDGSTEDLTESRGFEHEDKISENEAVVSRNRSPHIEEVNKSEVVLLSSSDSDSNFCGSSNLFEEVKSEVVTVLNSDSGSDVDENANSRTPKGRKKIRRILDDAELGEETKKKIAIEKERQERLRSLEVTEFVMVGKGAGVEVLDNASSGYIINMAREEDEEAVRIPPSISMKLKLHQLSGIRFMWENIIQSVRKVRSGDRGLGCILAHTMGLGKTFQVIAFLYTVMRCADTGLKTALILTPVNVLHNWRHEFLKWRPSELKPLQIFMLEDVPREKRLELLMKWRTKGGVFLIGYTAFRNLSLGKYIKDPNMAREISLVLQVGPDILVCDEAHLVKNTLAGTTQALKQVKCQRRIALTGSPLQNNLMEYYCMVNFVREGYLGSCHEFRNRFQNPIENGQHADATSEDVKIMNQRSHILYKELKGFIHRMGTGIVKKDLPPKTVFVVAVKLSTLQRKLYRSFLDVHGFAKGIECGYNKSFFAGYQALAQILNHPCILQLMKENKDRSKFEALERRFADGGSGDENVEYNVISGEKLQNPHKEHSNALAYNQDWWSSLLPENSFKDVDYSGKMVLLLDILTMCSDMGDKVLVFSQSLSTLDLIEYYLSRLPRPHVDGKCWEKGKDWYRLDGSTDGSERQKLVDRFNEPLNIRTKCVLISTRAGSLGINLYAANRVIIVDGSWNPTYDLQAIYRVWRYGQTKPVFAYRLMAQGTIEEKIYKRQVNKEGLAARVVDRQQVHRTVSRKEMVDLFDFADEETKPNTTGSVGASSDEVMQSLINKHHPRWILSYHEHETLLRENEDEKLSKEEQDLAWEVYKKTLKFSVDPSTLGQQQSSTVQPAVDLKLMPENDLSTQAAGCHGKCTELSHQLTLRSQGTKMGCCTICGECGHEISWEGQKLLK
ncbi:P-loop containing nucleoside triphosphate hydrolases superfamily protein [Perilla frutescens var. hirtella]|uniref:P-loop containing nucleoside triphosphate hydrolases superfamily protein n=1 Tax=Perilla frutescens var. hirtella TaxID=608512 RepID=A0AAD4JF67_PERFH|nr:P-loop containing nucleoside triphosphate hydrolases superfamily protein [Perilla frutescens var. hirtella]